MTSIASSIGTIFYPNGDKYVGDVAYGKRHGEGKMYYANGGTYEGEWNNDEKDGKGNVRMKL